MTALDRFYCVNQGSRVLLYSSESNKSHGLSVHSIVVINFSFVSDVLKFPSYFWNHSFSLCPWAGAGG